MDASKIVQANESQNLVAQTQHFALVHAMNFLAGDSRDFNDGRERNSEQAPANAEKKGLDASESQGRAQLDGGAFAGLREDVDGSL